MVLENVQILPTHSQILQQTFEQGKVVFDHHHHCCGLCYTEPVRLPDIPVVVKKKNTTWTIQEVDEKSRRSPTADDDTALKMLKEKKQANRTEYRLDFCQLDR